MPILGEIVRPRAHTVQGPAAAATKVKTNKTYAAVGEKRKNLKKVVTRSQSVFKLSLYASRSLPGPSSPGARQLCGIARFEFQHTRPSMARIGQEKDRHIEGERFDDENNFQRFRSEKPKLYILLNEQSVCTHADRKERTTDCCARDTSMAFRRRHMYISVYP